MFIGNFIAWTYVFRLSRVFIYLWYILKCYHSCRKEGSNARMTSLFMKWKGSDTIWDNIPTRAWRDRRRPRKKEVRTAGNRDETWTWNL